MSLSPDFDGSQAHGERKRQFVMRTRSQMPPETTSSSSGQSEPESPIHSGSGIVPSGDISCHLLDLPTKSIDQWSTYIRVPSTATVPPTPYLFLDEIALSEQATWVMPAISESGLLSPKFV